MKKGVIIAIAATAILLTSCGPTPQQIAQQQLQQQAIQNALQEWEHCGYAKAKTIYDIPKKNIMKSLSCLNDAKMAFVRAAYPNDPSLPLMSQVFAAQLSVAAKYVDGNISKAQWIAAGSQIDANSSQEFQARQAGDQFRQAQAWQNLQQFGAATMAASQQPGISTLGALGQGAATVNQGR